MVVLNIGAQWMLDQIAESHAQGSFFDLLNQEGYWLQSPQVG
jgi:hypothetical protein